MQVRLRHFFEDLGHDTAQTPALLHFDADRFSDCFRGIKVIQIPPSRFPDGISDCFAHGQFFKRLAEVEHLVAVRHFGIAEDVLREGADRDSVSSIESL